MHFWSKALYYKGVVSRTEPNLDPERVTAS